MKIVVLDAKTLGDDINYQELSTLGELIIYDNTKPEQIKQRLKDCDVAIMNKQRPTHQDLDESKNLKLIVVTATGYDNIDVEYCKKKGIAVSNVVAYSTDSVAQVCVSLVLELITHMGEYINFVKSGNYTKIGVANKVSPPFYELAGKKWGIVGMGNIGKKVANIATAFGCRVVGTSRGKKIDYPIENIDEIFKTCDIITIHLPLTKETKAIVNRERLNSMKQGAVIVNVSRGAVVDEEAMCELAKEGKIFAATDVYSKEPFDEESCFYKTMECKNLVLTPHMAWGAVEARQRCVDEVTKNIIAFLNGDERNRVDLI